jgi:hypothetical protein
MQSFHSVRSIFTHQNGLVMLLVPSTCFIFHITRHHVKSAGILIPSVVSIEAYNVKILCSQILLGVYSNGGSDWSSWIQFSCVSHHFLKILISIRLTRSGLIGNRPHHNGRMIAITMNELLDAKFMIFEKLLIVVSVKLKLLNFFLHILQISTYSVSTEGHSSIIIIPCSSANCIDSSE